MHTYGLSSRYDRLRDRGMLNKKEMADRLGMHEQTVDRWAKSGIIKAHLYNDHGWQLYELPGPDIPPKHCSRWDRLVDRAAGVQVGSQSLTRCDLEIDIGQSNNPTLAFVLFANTGKRDPGRVPTLWVAQSCQFSSHVAGSLYSVASGIPHLKRLYCTDE